MVELNDIYSNINNNKVFLDLPESFEIDYKEKEDVFNDINFKSIMNYKDVNFIKNNNNVDLLQNLNKTSDKSNDKSTDKSSDKSNNKTTDKFPNNSSGNSIKYKFKKNSFFEELSDLVFLNFREIKDCLFRLESGIILSKSDLDFLESAISRSTKISLPNFLKGSRTEEVNAA